MFLLRSTPHFYKTILIMFFICIFIVLSVFSLFVYQMNFYHKPSLSQDSRFVVNRDKVEPYCLEDFNTFAYTISRSEKQNRIPPLSPWKFSSTVLEDFSNGKIIRHLEPIGSRKLRGEIEIWIKCIFSYSQTSDSENIAFLIYYPSTNSWKTIPATLQNSEFNVLDVFISANGLAVGNTNVCDIKSNETINVSDFFVGFDNIESSFSKSGESISNQMLDRKVCGKKVIYVQSSDKEYIWLFLSNLGIYKLNTTNFSLEVVIKNDNFQFTNAVKGEENQIYFTLFSEQIYEKENFLKIVKGTLYSFNTKNYKITEIPIPENPWPIYSKILTDSRNNLWFDSIGYRSSTGSWVELLPKFSDYFSNSGDLYWSVPQVVIESSDGRIWFTKYLDGDIRGEGTAWYDPSTKKGCMFTNYSSKIIEDKEKTLWMVAENSLYSLSSSDSHP